MFELIQNGFATVKLLDLIEEKLSVGIWFWDLDTNVMRWSKGLHALFGVQPEKIAPSYSAMEQLIHIDDRKLLSEIDLALSESVSIDREFRIVLPDHRVRWIRSIIDPIVAPNGAPSAAIGICTDVTKGRDTLRVLQVVSNRFISLLKTANAIIWSATRDGSRAEIISAQIVKSAKSTDFKALLHPEDVGKFVASLGSREPFRIALRLRNEDGSYSLHLTRAAPVTDEAGEIKEWVGITRDPHAVEREWANAAGPQPLTGAQMRGARAILHWSVADLARAARVTPAVVRRLEEIDGASTVEDAQAAIETALRDAGVEFTRGLVGKPGVRPR